MDSAFWKVLDRRPVLVALAGPNGAGKSTFFEYRLEPTGLRLVNADVIARELSIDAYAAAEMATILRTELVARRESFVFETVFSDPVGDKLQFLKDAAALGYTVILCFIGISGPETSEQRVAMRVLQGGHDVPAGKLTGRYPRILENLRRALLELPHIFVYDNDDLRTPYRLVVVAEKGKVKHLEEPAPAWLRPLLP